MRLVAFLVCACSSLGVGGCFVEADPGPPLVGHGDGTLTVDWTINGTTDPNQCNQASATTLEVTVNPGGVYDSNCEDFSTSIDLPPGNYSANAVLLDGNGNERTTVVGIDSFTIFGNDDLHTPIDFPADSFH